MRPVTPFSPPPPLPGLHVAIIMDGNGRWATQRGWPRLMGHRKGVERVRDVVENCPDLGVRYLTLYAFSTENWKRSTEEVLGLMRLFERYIRRETHALREKGVRVRFIGDRRPLEPRLQRLMAGIESETAPNDRLHLTIAINYGGRNEITRAMREIAGRVARGELPASAIDETTIAGALDTAALPDPDLVIRTSGECRVSNYLPWQAAYSEYHFTPTLWPDFTAECLAEVLSDFASRDRRFGGVKS
jgi:undecaprenyl diphosphate synthase